MIGLFKSGALVSYHPVQHEPSILYRFLKRASKAPESGGMFLQELDELADGPRLDFASFVRGTDLGVAPPDDAPIRE
jgi:hypothetical protein